MAWCKSKRASTEKAVLNFGERSTEIMCYGDWLCVSMVQESVQLRIVVCVLPPWCASGNLTRYPTVT